MKISDRLGAALITGVLRMLGSLPLRYLDRIAGWIGDAWFAIDRRHRSIALKNLQGAFYGEKPTAMIHRLALECFQNIARILFEIGWSLGNSLDCMGRHISIRGLSNYHNAMGQKKGVLLLSAHLGNWELMSVVAARVKMPVHVLYRPLDVGAMDRFFYRYRSRFGARLIPNARSMRKIMRALRQHEVVAVLLDQNVDWYEGVFVDFFGKSACTNQGLALVALTTKAPVIPVFLVRQGEGFVAEFGEEIPLIQTGDRRKDLEENTQSYTRILEDAIRRFPSQWLWVHQRWKTRPSQPWPRQAVGVRKGVFENPI